MNLIIAAFFLLIIIYYLWSSRKFYLIFLKLGGPLGLPLIGCSLNFVKREKIIPYLERNKAIYGSPFYGFLGLFGVLVISDPVTTEKIFTSPIFVDKAYIYRAVTDCVGEGLFSSKSEKWYHNRKHLNPVFKHKILVSFFPVFNEVVNVFNKRLESFIGKEFDISVELGKCTLEIACQTTMGKKMNFQNGKSEHILQNYINIMDVTTKRIFVPWLGNRFLFRFSSMWKPYTKQLKLMNEFVQKLMTDSEVSSRNSLLEMSSADSDDIVKTNNIFLEQVIKLKNSGQFTETDVANESNTMILAAFETTANTMYLILLCLAWNPQYQDRLFDEISNYYPQNEFEVTFEDTQNFPFMDMVINEAMRLFAPVPIIARTCTKDFDLGNNVIVPEGTQVAVDIFNMQRDEAVWGPRAKQFYPDHFLKENLEKIHSYGFVPFTKGIRNCIGWRYGVLSMKVMLTLILKKYKFHTNFKYENLRFVEDVTLKFADAPLVYIEKRS